MENHFYRFSRSSGLHAGALALLVSLAQSAPQTGCAWQTRPDCPQKRFEATGALVNGKVYVMGGFTDGLQSLDGVDIFDSASGTWSVGADMPSNYNHAGVAVDGDVIWTAGGFDGDHPGVAWDNVWKYDTVADSWSPGPGLPELRASGGLVRLDRNLHYFGGVEADRTTVAAEHWVLDLDDQGAGWVPAAPLPVPRCHVSAIGLGGLAYALGGADDHDVNPFDLDDVHSYDPQTDAWTARADMPFPRSHFEPATFIYNGMIFVAGGRANTTGFADVSDMSAYDPQTDTWTRMPSIPESLVAPVVRLLGDEIFLTTGGNQNESYAMNVSELTAVHDTVRANAGGVAYVAQDGAQWCWDSGFLGGIEFSDNNVSSIAGTNDDELFKVQRIAPNLNSDELYYEYALVPGLYRLRLYFAELQHMNPGSRVFDVLAEGQLLLDDYDPVAAVGFATADIYTFDLELTDGVLDLDFLSSSSRPMINAIEVTRLPDGSFGNYCAALPNSTGQISTISFFGTTSLAANHFTLLADMAPPNVSGLFFLGGAQTSVAFGDGVRCVAMPLQRIPPNLTVDGAGHAARAFDFAQPYAAMVMAGSVTNFQFWYRDQAGGPAGFNLSNAIEVLFTL